MGTSSDMNSECEICGGQSFLVEDSHYDSTEEHCLNEKCRFYNVDSGTLKDECPEHTFDGSGFRTPDEFKEFLEEMEWKKCEKCGNVDYPHNEESPYYCQDCETENEEVTNS